MTDTEIRIVEARLRQYVDGEVSSLKELLDERRDAVRGELLLFREKLDEHLKTLNNEALRLKTAGDKAVTLEKFEGFVDKVEMQLQAIGDRLVSLKEEAVREAAKRTGEAAGVAETFAGEARAAAKEARAATRMSLVVGVLSILGWLIVVFSPT